MPSVNLTLETIQNLPTKGFQYDVYDAKEPGLIVRVNSSGKKTYVALYGRGKRKKIAGFGDISLAVARQKTKDLLSAANNGKLAAHIKQEKNTTSGVTYREFLDNLYLPHLLAKRKTGGETYKMLVSAFSRTFPVKPPQTQLPPITETILPSITFSRIEKWQQDMLATGLEASSVNRYLRSFKASIKYAKDAKLLDDNPTKEIELVPEDETKERYLVDSEEPKFYSTLKRYPIDEFRVKVTLGIRSGARPCEVAAVTLCDIDLRRSSACVWFESAYTKTKKKRFTPLGRLARIVLYLYLRKKFRPQGIKLFKTFRRVERCYQSRIFKLDGIPDSHRRPWDTFMKASGIEEFTPYSMRHDFISKFVTKTGDTYTCAKLVGTSVIMIEKHYGHLAPQHARERMAALD